MRYRLCVLFLLVLPASATISYVRSNATWSGGTTSCSVSLLTTGSPDLVVAWGEWQTSGPNTVTATATQGQTGKTILSAVGPTVQSASNTAAQIFYVPNITTGGETVTLTFGGTGTVTSSACVIVEYSGADVNYPLDSVSAGYSTSGNPTSLLDSGNAAPANSNLMVFAGGVADKNVAIAAGSGFTSLQASNGTWGTGIVENSTTAIAGNNVLQRATACLAAGATCPTTPTGNWVMQMAVFRDASWTVAGGWTPVRPAQVLDVTQFPGSELGAKLCNAYAALGAGGGEIDVPAGIYALSNQCVFNTINKPVRVHCTHGGTVINVSGSLGSTPALVFDYGALPWQTVAMDGCYFNGPGTTTSVGMSLGDMNPQYQLANAVFRDNTIKNFGTGILVAAGGNACLNLIQSSVIAQNGIGIDLEETLALENMRVSFSSFSANGIDLQIGGGAEVYFNNNSLDNYTGTASVYITGSGPANFFSRDNHYENPSGSTAASYIYDPTNRNARIVVTGGEMLDMRTAGTNNGFVISAAGRTEVNTLVFAPAGPPHVMVTQDIDLLNSAGYADITLVQNSVTATAINSSYSGPYRYSRVDAAAPQIVLQGTTFALGTANAPGVALYRFAYYQATESPSSVVGNTCAAQTFTNVTGISYPGDILIFVNKPSEQAGLSVTPGHVTANNTAKLNFCNNTSSTITPTAGESYTFGVTQ